MKNLLLLLAAGAVICHAAADLTVATPTPWPSEPAFAALASTPPPLPGPDLDKDGLSDFQELRLGTDPTKPDTDGDGFNDGQEYNLRTDPKAPDKYPLFLLSTNSHLRLLGETLIIRPTALTNFIVVTNIQITNIPPVYEGTPVDTDDDGELDGCDADGDGVADTFELCAITTPGETRTNITIITNFVNYQWFARGEALPTQTNLNLVLLGAKLADAGAYYLEASLLASAQTSDDVPVRILPASAKVSLPLTGKAIAWGNNVAGQSTVPADLTNVLQVVPGFLHSAALRADGSVSVWGDSGYRQTDVPRDAVGLIGLASGSGHLLGLRTNGTVMAWGANQFGQATLPAGLTNVTALAAGYFHSVALLADGSVIAWGDNTFGQTNVPSRLPPIRKLSAGMYHTVALGMDGSVHCWGGNEAGQSSPDAVADLLVDIVDVAAGTDHSVALRRDGIVVAWGDNSANQTSMPADLPKVVEIGAGNNVTAVITLDRVLRLIGDPALIQAPATTRPAGISGGFFHVVGLDGVPDRDNDGLDDPYERISNTGPDEPDSDKDGVSDGIEVRVGSNPNAVDTDLDGLTDLLELLNGFDPAVAAEAPTGSLAALPAVELEVFASGRTRFQFQGSADGTEWTNLWAPYVPRGGITRILTNAAPSMTHYRLLPLERVEGQPLPEVGAPEPVTLGTVAAWGDNEFGQSTVAATLDGVRSLAAGIWHTLALRLDGSVVAWGLNSAGQCDVPSDLGEVTALAGGGLHSLALRANGEVIGWGSSAYGQANPPMQDLPATAIAAGGSHSLALLVDGTVLAWGANEAGQAQVPAGLQDVMAISAGRFHSVALRADGTVVAWGDNRLGQSTVPAGLPPVAAIAAGFGHTAVVTQSGNVLCWGNNADGQCDVPAGLTGITAVLVGNNVTIARDATGRFTVWGIGAENLTARLNAFGATAAVAAGGGHVAAANTAVDADSDGVDDAYEVSLGMNPGSSDSDGDGLDDQTELLAGFDPTVASESADGTVRTHDALKLRFFTLDGETWRLERTTDFTTWRTETALRPSAQFSNRNGFTEVFVGLRNRDAQVWRLLRVLPAANP